MWRPRTLVAVIMLFALAAAGGATLAAFSDTSVNTGNTMTAKRIFPGVRTTTGWTVNDQADGSVADLSDPTTVTDGVYASMGNWATAYSATRFVSMDFMGTRPAGLAVSSAMLRLDMAAAGAGSTLCFYFDVIKTSDGSVLASHGNSTTPAGCVTGTTITAVDTALPEVTSTNIANDLSIKLYAKDSGGKPIRIDRVAITGSTPYNSFAHYRQSTIDSADGSAATVIWGPALNDTNALATGGNFGGTFASNKYVEVTFPTGHVPTGSTINSVDLSVKFKSPNAGRAMCVYYEAYSGATLVGTTGSTSSPYCSDSASNWRTDTIALAGVDTVAEVNGLKLRIYGQVSGGGKGSWDLIQLRPNYHLD